MIMIELTATNADPNAQVEPVRNYRRVDYIEMRRRLRGMNLEQVKALSVEEGWSLIKNSLEKVVKELVRLRNERKNNQPRWMNGEVKEMVKRKKRAWNKWKSTKKDGDRADYK